MTNTARAVKSSPTNLATLGTEQGAGFLSFPREFVRTCWRFLRLKELAFLVALVDLADGRWTLPIALAQLARLAGLSAGNAREAAQQLAAAGVIAREPTAPGVYRWSFAAPADWLTVASKLAHRGPKPRPVSRPAQIALPLDAGSLVSPPPPPPPPSSPPPRARLALVTAPASSPTAAPAEVRAAVEAEALAAPAPFDDVPTVPAPPPAPATERCPPPDFDDDGIPGVEVPDDDAPPTDRAALLEGPPPGALRLPPPRVGGLFDLLAGGERVVARTRGWAYSVPHFRGCSGELNHAPRAGMHFGYPYCHAGTLADPATAHLARTRHSPALALDQLTRRLGRAHRAEIHGRVLGSGLEMAAFCGWVSCRPDAVLGLPELALGLIPAWMMGRARIAGGGRA